MRGHPILVLHGQPGLGSDWRQVAGLLPGELTVAALDRPGYGANRQGAGGFDLNARAVLAEMDARGIDRAVLVGHSYGGGVALTAARLAPERTEALILLASVGPGCLTGWDRLLAAPVAGEICALAAWSLTPWLARAALIRIARRRGRAIAADEYVNWDIWGNSRYDHGPLWRSFLTEQRALVTDLADLTSSLARIPHPALVLADPRDNLVPVETAYELAALLPAARLELLDDVGHHLPRRAPAQIAQAIVRFLAELDDRPDRDLAAAARHPAGGRRLTATLVRAGAAPRRDGRRRLAAPAMWLSAALLA